MSVEETTQARPRSSRASLIVNVALSLIAFGLLAWTVKRNEVKLREVWARKPDLSLFAAGLALYVAALLVTFLRWHRLVRALGLPFRVRDAIRLGFIGNVFNLVIPGAVGGDVIKAGFLCREQEKKTQAVASMVIDRAVGLLGLFVLAGAVGIFAWRGASVEVRRLIGFSWMMAALGAVGLAVLFTPALNRVVLLLVKGRGKLESIFLELVAMASSYRERWGVIFVALAMAVAGHAMYVLCFYLAGRGLFGIEAPSLLEHYLVVPLVLFSTAIPMPFGALGVSEQVSKSLFLNIVGSADGDIEMLGFRAIMYAGGLVSVLVYIANARQVRALREPS
jgi:hypothetical protein